MKKRRLIIRSAILVVLATAIGYTLFTHFSEERGLVDAGDTAPDFALEDMDGNLVHLDELKGKGVYLTFWATYCTYCRDKMEYLKEYHEEYKEKGVEVVALNVDESTVQVQRFLDRHNVPYTNVIDRGMKVSNAYGVNSLPAVLLIDENGSVIERQVGGKTEQQVLESLDKLVPGSE
ncbi:MULTISPECIES: thiol-disulfide oxidoreductase ResA [Alteribacter]|uniref:Thiol-disulfide oxidoreductase ResA n=1 Tax=Alteribacter keqinensis TaxID=2483800 RepID=A0A3M7TUG5_9BACI|nr:MULTISPECIES: thiol-disulfide oxidoreductase ResA [Alteribacter]MBM7094710.1 thiol-disulfide oxidoreductase ResA [Alteribacter salitolerans]RNA69093.1 thiol-disulfide oxidoreductase ResA [Alteribacter keqinensis]